MLYYVLLVIYLLLLSYNCIVERKTLVRKHLQRFITKSEYCYTYFYIYWTWCWIQIRI